MFKKEYVIGSYELIYTHSAENVYAGYLNDRCGLCCEFEPV